MGIKESTGENAKVLSASELQSWAQGSGTVLGPYDFQDLLECSRVYLNSYYEYDGKEMHAPWPKRKSTADIDKQQEDLWDRAMLGDPS